MCTSATIRAGIAGSAKGPGSAWFHVTDATVYFDHPVHAMAEHTLNIDFANPVMGPSARVAVELTEASAQELLVAIQAALASATSSGISGRAPRPDARRP
jgi:hypothetical protein